MIMVRVKVRESWSGFWFDFGIFDHKKMLMDNYDKRWRNKKAAIRNAKAMAKRIGILYSDEIIKQHGF